MRGLSAGGRRTPPQQPQPEGRAGVSHEEEAHRSLARRRNGARGGSRGAAAGHRRTGKGPGPVGFTIVPGSTEVGYDVKGDTAELIATRVIEVDFGSG